MTKNLNILSRLKNTVDVHSSGGKFFFVLKSATGFKKVKGITKALRKKFYPSYKAVKSYKYTRGSAQFSRRTTFSSSSSSSSSRGIKGGIKVHNQIHRYFSDPTFKATNMDKRTAAIIKTIKKINLKVVASEYVVIDRENMVGTAVDLVCVNGRNEIVLVEVKTGYTEQYSDEIDKMMKTPLESMDQSPWSQHQIQMMVTQHLFKSFSGISPKASLLFLVNPLPINNSCSVSVYPLESKTLILEDVAYDALLNSIHENKMKKKRKKCITEY